jgi:hypothetical protein
MALFRISLTIAVLTVSMASSALAAEEVLRKNRAGDNYCQMKFPALSQRSLVAHFPSPKSASTGDIIDYYGACDETPTGADQFLHRKHESAFMIGRQYEDGD